MAEHWYDSDSLHKAKPIASSQNVASIEGQESPTGDVGRSDWRSLTFPLQPPKDAVSLRGVEDASASTQTWSSLSDELFFSSAAVEGSLTTPHSNGTSSESTRVFRNEPPHHMTDCRRHAADGIGLVIATGPQPRRLSSPRHGKTQRHRLPRGESEEGRLSQALETSSQTQRRRSRSGYRGSADNGAIALPTTASSLANYNTQLYLTLAHIASAGIQIMHASWELLSTMRLQVITHSSEVSQDAPIRMAKRADFAFQQEDMRTTFANRLKYALVSSRLLGDHRTTLNVFSGPSPTNPYHELHAFRQNMPSTDLASAQIVTKVMELDTQGALAYAIQSMTRTTNGGGQLLVLGMALFASPFLARCLLHEQDFSDQLLLLALMIGALIGIRHAVDGKTVLRFQTFTPQNDSPPSAELSKCLAEFGTGTQLETSATALLRATQEFDALTNESLSTIRNVELVARGHALSHRSIYPFSRLEVQELPDSPLGLQEGPSLHRNYRMLQWRQTLKLILSQVQDSWSELRDEILPLVDLTELDCLHEVFSMRKETASPDESSLLRQGVSYTPSPKGDTLLPASDVFQGIAGEARLHQNRQRLSWSVTGSPSRASRLPLALELASSARPADAHRNSAQETDSGFASSVATSDGATALGSRSSSGNVCQRAERDSSAPRQMDRGTSDSIEPFNAKGGCVSRNPSQKRHSSRLSYITENSSPSSRKVPVSPSRLQDHTPSANLSMQDADTSSQTPSVYGRSSEPRQHRLVGQRDQLASSTPPSGHWSDSAALLMSENRSTRKTQDSDECRPSKSAAPNLGEVAIASTSGTDESKRDEHEHRDHSLLGLRERFDALKESRRSSLCHLLALQSQWGDESCKAWSKLDGALVHCAQTLRTSCRALDSLLRKRQFLAQSIVQTDSQTLVDEPTPSMQSHLPVRSILECSEKLQQTLRNIQTRLLACVEELQVPTPNFSECGLGEASTTSRSHMAEEGKSSSNIDTAKSIWLGIEKDITSLKDRWSAGAKSFEDGRKVHSKPTDAVQLSAEEQVGDSVILSTKDEGNVEELRSAVFDPTSFHSNLDDPASVSANNSDDDLSALCTQGASSKIPSSLGLEQVFESIAGIAASLHGEHVDGQRKSSRLERIAKAKAHREASAIAQNDRGRDNCAQKIAKPDTDVTTELRGVLNQIRERRERQTDASR
ncbi:unnamed protein product [Jaminaea pallidilutea]